jgi:hypothetical protein
MDQELKRKNLGDAMREYRVAVLKGLRCDRVDGCWQAAVLAMPFMFDKRLVRRCRRELQMHPEDRPSSK